MRNVYLYGALGQQFGEKHQFDCDTVADAIDALRANFIEFFNAIRNGHFRVVIGKTEENGLELEEAMLPGFKLGQQDLHIVPVTQGAKRGGVGKIIAGIALIGLSIATGGSALMSTTLFGSTTAGAIVGQVGLGLALTGVASLIAPEQNAPDDSKSFTMSGPQVTTREGGIVPIVYGEVWTGGTMVNGSLYIERSDA
jgi:predicted phage tail protein